MKRTIVAALCIGLLVVASGTFAAGDNAQASAVVSEKPLRSSVGKANDDSRLRRAIYKALKHDGGVATAAMIIRVKNGRVTLEGTVPDVSQVARAAAVSQSVSGVISVNNRLRVEVEEN